MLFSSSVKPEYRQSNADAHRVRAPNLTPPALISHQAFWISHKEQKERSQDRLRVKGAIDDVILRIASWTKQRHQTPVRIYPQLGGTNVLFANVAFATHFLIKQNSLSPDGKLDYATLSEAEQNVFDSDHRVVSILFQLLGCDVTIRFEFHTEYFSISTFAEIVDFSHFERRQFVEQLQSGLIQDRVGQIKQELYESFWWELTNSICPAKSLEDPIFQRMFCDFRGVVISNDKALERDRTAGFVDAYLPVLSPLWFAQTGHECTVSYMLGGRALYMTTLGPQLPENSVQNRIPVTYLLSVSSSTKRWQRGALIDLIHSAGASRLAGLKDLAALRKAGNDLAGLDHDVALARSAVSKHRGPATEKQTSPLSVTDSISNAHDYFNKITDSFYGNVQADYGILYRVERSRYYVARFRANTKQMRIVRIEGYQEYDRFVENRLGGTFDFIDRLGRRYERAVAALALLDSYNLSIQSNEIALSQMATEEQETAISDNIRKLQEYGDFILIAALLPYYLTGLIIHIYGDETPAGRETIEYFTYAISTLAFIFAMYRAKKESQRFARISWPIILVTMGWLAIWGFDKTSPLIVKQARLVIHWIVSQVHAFF